MKGLTLLLAQERGGAGTRTPVCLRLPSCRHARGLSSHHTPPLSLSLLHFSAKGRQQPNSRFLSPTPSLPTDHVSFAPAVLPSEAGLGLAVKPFPSDRP